MVESDTRIETLEDEIKVLKGEVRRTLVDLRALLMREDSPLNEGTFGRPAALQDAEVGGEPMLTRKEVTEMVRQETADVARPAVQDTQPPSPPPSANPGQSVPQGVGMANPGPAFPGMPIPQNPMLGMGGGYPPPPQAAPSVPQVPNQAMVDRERNLAEQERRMEEQEHRLADQERRLTSATWSEDARQRDLDLRAVREEAAQKSPEAVTSGTEPERRPAKRESDREPDQEEQILLYQEQRDERPEPEEETALPRRGPSSDLEKQSLYQETEDEDNGQPEVKRPVRSGDEDALEDTTERVVRNRLEGSRSPGKPERLLVDNREDKDVFPKGITGNGRGNRVYDEYIELLSETEELDGADDKDLIALPLDVNLLSSLTRWTSVARNQVGEQRLIEILDLYSQSGHLPASLRKLLQQISGLVDAAQPETSGDTQGFVDLIFHLHGILAGGLAIQQIQQAKPVN